MRLMMMMRSMLRILIFVVRVLTSRTQFDFSCGLELRVGRRDWTSASAAPGGLTSASPVMLDIVRGGEEDNRERAR
jgi:hypothetical protein